MYIKSLYSTYISLIADEANLRKRLTKDVEKGIRSEDVIERSVARILMYKTLNTIKIDISFQSYTAKKY